MKTQRRQMEVGTGTTRSVLDCGGNPALAGATPLSDSSDAGVELRRRFVLPEQSKTWRNFVGSLLFLAATLTARAQSYSIDWFTIDGGGGTSTGGVYSVSGTIGQPDAGGPMTNGQYSVTGGFWVLPVAVQSDGAPALTIAKAAPGFATISWLPATGTNWVLQETWSFSPPSWTNSPSGATNPIVVPATLPSRFYRLFKP